MVQMKRDTPISFGLALEELQRLRMEQVGIALEKQRELRVDPAATPEDIEQARAELDMARAAVATSRRATDEEARRMLAQEGIFVCKR